MTDGSDNYYVAVPAWHDFMVQALPTMGDQTWPAPPDGLVARWGNYYLPGTVPANEPSSSLGSGGGGGDHKKHHGGGNN